MRRLTVFALLSALLLAAGLVSLRAQDVSWTPPSLVRENDWTMVVIPDPQAYSRYARNQGIFELVTAWIAENREKLAIDQVVCVGDLVESNGLLKADGVFANQTGEEMWKSTSRAFERLDGVFPYILCTGNHDYGPEIYPEGTHY
ncbi:MAG: metallophosphoesterase, partial [Thermoguttaceae bacterium]|nr:metallophosphoesterase [Thermoguttaceae bacterium]